MGGLDNQTGLDEEEELKMKIVLYYHTLVSCSKASTYVMINLLIDSNKLTVSFMICLVLRHSFTVVRAHAAAELQEALKAPVYRPKCEDLEEFDLGLR